MGISLVMPVYNEEAVIEDVVRDCHAQVIAKIEGSEFLIINDASTDSTFDILERLSRELPLIRLINLEQNRGHGNALRVGFRQAKNPVILQMDSDGQVKAQDFWKLYPRLKDSDIVLGWRACRRDPLYRKTISLGLRLLNKILFGISVNDINSPLKCIKAKPLQEALNDLPPDAFVISVLIVIWAKHKGYRIAEVPIHHFPRMAGRSCFSGHRYLFKGCVRCLADLLRVRKMVSGTRR
jgi:dolichol-phosphate mannosyltransferase